MKVESLREFLVIGEYQSLSKAAAKLHISQSALSKHVSDLEKEIGTKLVERGKHTEPTLAGEVLLEKAEELIRIHDSIIESCREAGRVEAKSLVIYAPNARDHTAGALSAAGALAMEDRSLPRVKIRQTMDSLFTALLNGEVDMGTFKSFDDSLNSLEVSDDEFDLTPIARERMGICVSSSHPLATKTPLTLKDLEEVPINVPVPEQFKTERLTLESLRSAFNINPHFLYRSVESMNEFAILNLEESALVIARPIITGDRYDPVARQGITFRIDFEPQLWTTVYAVTRKGEENERLAAFIDVLRKAIASEASRSDGEYVAL